MKEEPCRICRGSWNYRIRISIAYDLFNNYKKLKISLNDYNDAVDELIQYRAIQLFKPVTRKEYLLAKANYKSPLQVVAERLKAKRSRK